MHITALRDVGGTVMLEIPPEILGRLQIGAGSGVVLTVEGGALHVQPRRGQRYTLDELLAECDASAAKPAEDQAWASGLPIGRELL